MAIFRQFSGIDKLIPLMRNASDAFMLRFCSVYFDDAAFLQRFSGRWVYDYFSDDRAVLLFSEGL